MVSLDWEQRTTQRDKHPATEVKLRTREVPVLRDASREVLIIDLNNLATFPTMAIGVLAASLRGDGHRVRVMVPLAHGVPTTAREYRETRFDDIRRRIYLSTSRVFSAARSAAFQMYRWRQEMPHARVLAETKRALLAGPEVVLLSAYLHHFNSVREIARMAKDMGIPVLLGGPMFNIEGTSDVWRKIDGLTAVVGAEADLSISGMVETACTGGDLLQFPGVQLPNGVRSRTAPPFRHLDDGPIPDYSDFPWGRYPVRVIPTMTGRGCQWDKCLFCSDVISTTGRTFRTRSVDSVLFEMQELARRHDTTNFIFLDLKLNSYPEMFRGIAENIQKYIQGAEWIGSVHVDLRRDNGLSRDDLIKAVKSGMRRINFGLESGSQRLLDLMAKGTSVEANAAFIRAAYDAGLSIRCSMFRGFPGETTEDMEQTVRFLEAHGKYLDRIKFVDFKLSEGTPIHEAILAKNELAAGLTVRQYDPRRARLSYWNRDANDRAYRRAVSDALSLVHQINRKELRNSAQQFDGLM